jgi:hypothetical protein
MTLGLHRIGVEVRPSEKTRHAMQAGKAPGKRCRCERSPIPDRAEVVPQISPSTRFSFSGAGAAAVETGITPRCPRRRCALVVLGRIARQPFFLTVERILPSCSLLEGL